MRTIRQTDFPSRKNLHTDVVKSRRVWGKGSLRPVRSEVLPAVRRTLPGPAALRHKLGDRHGSAHGSQHLLGKLWGQCSLSPAWPGAKPKVPSVVLREEWKLPVNLPRPVQEQLKAVTLLQRVQDGRQILLWRRKNQWVKRQEKYTVY